MPVKRWEKVCAILGVILIAVGFLFGHPPADSRREILIQARLALPGAATCHIPAVLLVPPQQKPLGAAVVLHGLAANRRIMTMLGESLAASGLTTYLLDLPGHGDNTDPFTFARAEDCSAAAVQHLVQRGEITIDRTVLVGHSLGGDIAIRLADRFTTRATIAISPGPLVPVPGVPAHLHAYDPPRNLPDNLLIFFGGLDIPGFEYGTRKWLTLSNTNGTAPRNLDLVIIPWVSHTSLVFSNRVHARTNLWLHRTLGSNVHSGGPSWTRLVSLLVCLGVLLVFPGSVSLGRMIVVPVASPEEERAPFSTFAYSWILGAVVAAIVLALVQVGWAPDLSTGACLSGFLLVAGVIILIRAPQRFRRRTTAAMLATGCGAGLYLLFALGAALNANWTDLWMNAPRWLSFPFVLAAVLPYTWMEEGALRFPPSSMRERLLRLGRFLLLRGILWAAMVLALFFLGSPHVLVVVMGLVFLLWSLGQRIASDIVRRRLGFPAAAVCSAILTAWFIAAVFPLT